MRVRRQVLYSGHVQGVGFRYSVKQIATGFDVTGWVRNLSDGTVEMQAAGEAAEVEAFMTAVAGSHLAGYIKQARLNEFDLGDQAEAGFKITA